MDPNVVTITWRFLFFFDAPIWFLAFAGALGDEAYRQHALMPTWVRIICSGSALMQAIGMFAQLHRFLAKTA